MSTLADEVDYGPMFLLLLQMPVIQISQLTPSEPASEQDRKDRAVSLALQSLRVRRLPQQASFLRCEPVTEPHAELLDALYAADTGRQLWAEQDGVRRFVGEAPNSCERAVDRSYREVSVFEVNAVPGDHRLVER